MGTYSVNSGETRKFAEVRSPGESFIIRTDEDIRLSLSRENADRGTLLLGGDRAEVLVPPNSEPLLYGEASSTATVEVYPNGVNSLEQGDSIRVRYTPQGEIAVSGTVNADVTDRTGRDLGKARIMDSGGTLIADANPFPIDIQAANAALEIGTWSAGTLTVDDPALDNEANLHVASLSPPSGGSSFGAQTVPDGKAVLYLADPGNGSNITLENAAPIEPAAGITLAVTDVSTPTFHGDSSATIYAIVEVA